jgi:hypothetical protein
MDHPNDGLSFQELCAAIKRSDPAVTRVSARRFEGHVGTSRLLELGTILWNNGGGNSIVSEIDFHPRNLSPETSQSAQVPAESTSDDDSTAESHPFLLWIKQGAPSLTAVRLISESVTEVDVLERVMRALAGNPSICMFEAVDFEFPLPILTEYLTSAHAPSSLQRLKFEVSYHVTERLSEPEWQAPAQAIGALSKLEELELSGFCLSPMMYWWPTALSLPASLRRLTIKDESQWKPYKSFCDSWAALRHLEHVELHSLRIDDAEMWNVLESALQSTPSLSSLHLFRALFLDEAVRHFVSYMGSNDASRQHVRRLQLSYCVLRETTNGNPPRPVRPYYILGGMLCGSLLEHVSLDVATLHNVANFLHILTANASILRLQSLKLLDFNTANVLPSASEFVAVTAHLRCLILDFRSSDIEHNALRTFVTSLRSNASLNSVQLQCNGSTLDLDDRNARRIQSVTTRNRLLPEQ